MVVVNHQLSSLLKMSGCGAWIEVSSESGSDGVPHHWEEIDDEDCYPGINGSFSSDTMDPDGNPAWRPYGGSSDSD